MLEIVSQFNIDTVLATVICIGSCKGMERGPWHSTGARTGSRSRGIYMGRETAVTRGKDA